MVERTFVLIKPDAVERQLVGEIVGRIERTGLKLVAMRMVSVDTDLALLHYGNEIERKHGKKVRAHAAEQLKSGPCMAMIWEGPNAIESVREIVGRDLDPTKCLPGTIRRDLSTDSVRAAAAEERAIQNLVHAADTADSAKREIALWFGGGRAYAM